VRASSSFGFGLVERAAGPSSHCVLSFQVQL
jgi:hypothetical protein